MLDFETEVLQRLTRIEEKVSGAHERLSDIEHDLYGNGREGLIVEHAKLKTTVDERTDPKKVAGVTSLLTAVITVLGALFAREAGI